MHERSSVASLDMRIAPPLPVFAIVWLLVGLGLAAVTIAGHGWHYAVFSLPAWAMAVGLWIGRPGAFDLSLSEAGLEVGEPPQLIPYERIRSVTMRGVAQDPYGQLKAGAIALVHDAGVLDLPYDNQYATEQRYIQILQRLPPRGARQVQPELVAYRDQEEADFTEEKVYCFCSRMALGRRPVKARWMACSLLILVVGVIWIAVGAANAGPKKTGDLGPILMVFGILQVIFGGLFALVAWASSRHPNEKVFKNRSASIIVSPRGIAMAQGKMVGELRWDELRNVRFDGAAAQFFSGNMGVPFGLALVIDGAVIHIADIYDRPLPVIYRAIQRLWKNT